MVIKSKPSGPSPAGSPTKKAAPGTKSFPRALTNIYIIRGTAEKGTILLINMVYEGTNMTKIINGPSIGKGRASDNFWYQPEGNTLIHLLTDNDWINLCRSYWGAKDGGEIDYIELPKQDLFIKTFEPAATPNRIVSIADAINKFIISKFKVWDAAIKSGANANHEDWTVTDRQKFLCHIMELEAFLGDLMTGLDIASMIKDTPAFRAAFAISSDVVIMLTKTTKPTATETKAIAALSAALFGEDKAKDRCIRAYMQKLIAPPPTVAAPPRNVM